MIKRKSLLNGILFALIVTMLTSLVPIEANASNTKVDIRKQKEVYLIGDDEVSLTIGKTKSKVTWSTENKIVATVSKKGVIQEGVEYLSDEGSVGEFDYSTFIKANVGNKTYKCKLVRLDEQYIFLEPTSYKVITNGDPVNLYVRADGYIAEDIKKLGITYKVRGNSGVAMDTTEDFTSEIGGSFSNARIKATKAGKFKISVYAHGQQINTIEMEAVKVGSTQLDPVDAVKCNDYTGYSGNALTTLKWIRQFIDKNNLMSNSLSDREKIMIIQNYLTETANRNVNDTIYEGFISRILFNGYVSGLDCDPYSTTFCFICECINIQCYISVGAADAGDGEWIGHAWNRTKVDGKWYYIDAYWCATLRSIDKYFLTETVWTDHSLEAEGYTADICYDGEIPYFLDFD